MNTQKKDIWVKNFYVKNASYILVTTMAKGFSVIEKSLFGKTKIIKDYFLVANGLDFEGYFKRDDLEKLIDRTISIIYSNPEKVISLHKKGYQVNDDSLEYSSSLISLDPKKLSDQEIIEKYEQFLEHILLSQCTAMSTTWFVDSEGEHFSKKMIETTKKYCAGLDKDPAEVFSILTTPTTEKNIMPKEEAEFLRLLKVIFGDSNAVSLIKELKTFEQIPERLNPAITKQINEHYEKWRWMPFGYIGPAYGIDYFLITIKEALESDIDIDQQIVFKTRQKKELKTKQEEIFEELKISESDRKIYKIAADIVNLKAYRKDTFFYGCYAIQPYLKEIARRSYLSLNQIYIMTMEEVKDVLAGRRSGSFLSARQKSIVFRSDGKNYNILVGRDAIDFLAAKSIEQDKLEGSDPLNGTCACSGFGRGKVKIINETKDMAKMEKGDVMVAHTTFPSLVPAMKKAAAIITEDGGMTCHAAIVSRELRIPCVTGVRGATKLLKDGKIVEVDAGKGTVRII